MIGLAFSLIVSAAALLGPQEVPLVPATSPPSPSNATDLASAAPIKPTEIPNAAAKVEQPKETKKVCRVNDVTGSRLRRVQICRTTEEWVRIDEQAQRASRALLDPARGAPPKS
jgi:hypothetical protein